MKSTPLLTLAWIATCHAAPANLGLNFEKRAGSLPTLTLPYATYQASSYDSDGDVGRAFKGGIQRLTAILLVVRI